MSSNFSPLVPGSDRDTILVLNAGSSSLKFALFTRGPPLIALLRGEISDLGSAPHLLAYDTGGNRLIDRVWQEPGELTFAAALEALIAFVEKTPGHGHLSAVGHRIVHGGPDHSAPETVTPTLLTSLEALTPLDPIHMPHNLAPIRAVAKVRPGIAQVACFDTAFHRTMDDVAQRFALPKAVSDAGVRRYGFHGLSYEYIARRLAKDVPILADGRVIVAHLGAGASLCALDKGTSIATTFGISVLDGLVMATRCGDIDPGAIFYLGRLGHSLDDIEDMLYNRSGLLGVSGISGDIRVLLASDQPTAREAIALFVYRMALEFGAMASALEGLDGIVFTGGIGENAPMIRAAVCRKLRWLGVRLDEAANEKGAFCISAKDSAVDVRVIATDEEAMIAHHVLAITGEMPKNVAL
ncbi:acetate/propionate family kinase [soil metagenome]